MSSISIVIPAYNEAKRLPQTLQQIHHYMKSSGHTIEVLVVDDGSTDNTLAVVEQLQLENVRLLKQPKNLGKFAAFKRGVEEAQLDWILLYDADGATPIAMLDAFMPLAEQGYDLLVGSRRTTQSHITVQQSLSRQLFGRLAYFTIRTLTGVALKDTQCGFKLCRTTLAKRVVDRMQVGRFAGDVELIYLAQLFGGRVKEIPVEWHDVPNSTVHPRDYWHSLKDILKIRRNIKTGKYYQQK